ncbi:MAG: carbamoyltransferase HypF [Verrucomicrobia bacterium]|nr:carbamoyltransferase HypF [Verrucomicrobiota bacterium]
MESGTGLVIATAAEAQRTSNTDRAPAQADRQETRACLVLSGAVQGVGFRPFVFRLATGLGLRGWVNNFSGGVRIEIEGARNRVRQFIRRLEVEKPAHTLIRGMRTTFAAVVGYAGFAIRPSDGSANPSTLVMPDLATCPECRADIFDPHNRRYGYPFTNCTQCGPRFSILYSLPYDRPNTAMARFTMCEQCQAEYDCPTDRRFHAQPNACPVCGPHVELWDRTGRRLGSGSRALTDTATAVRQGAIVAVKGLGGFHLMAAAGEDRVIRRLRRLKHRDAKPFALMCATPAMIQAACQVQPLEDRLLQSAAAPIVLLRRRAGPNAGHPGWAIASLVAPGNPRLGIMLAYTPLHHLLLAQVGSPVVATSGNRADEPICTDEREALERLGDIAELFLVHDRPIVRPLDDSVVQVVAGHQQVLRRARGYAPLPIALGDALDQQPAEPGLRLVNRVAAATVGAPILAVGAQAKSTLALAVDRQVFLSPHIGDLDSARACAVFRRAAGDLQHFCGVRPTLIAADAHPDYHSTQFAHATGLTRLHVQHHYAHVLSCMAEHGLDGTLLGVAWDGTGFGADGTMWGGEFIRIQPQSWQRVGRLRTFPLPGGESAVYEPRRAALGLLYELFGDAAFAMRELAPLRAFTAKEIATLKHVLAQRLNGPLTSSAGRLFDAVASLVDLRQRVQFEGQAAMDLEFAVDAIETDETYRMRYSTTAPPADAQPASEVMVVDWAPMIEALIHDTLAGLPAWEITVKFHNALAEAIVAVAQHVGENRVVLSGGCFQNRLLTERAVQLLRAAGFHAYWHQRVPPNDGGLALGQAIAAARARRASQGPRPRHP